MALSRPLAVFAATSFALVALGTAAYAGPGDVLDSGDPRATVHDKNVTTCDGAGLPGETVQAADVKAEVGDTYVDVLDHTGITAVVVKGGSQYNVYLAKDLSGGWTGLHSPLNASGKPAQISHWFACGGPGTEQPPKEEQPPPTSTVTPSSSATAPATTVTTSPAPAGGQELAATGFGSAWLVGLGAALLAAGAAVLLVLRRRRA